jgi:hypothetical protein
MNRREILKAAAGASAAYGQEQDKRREGEVTAPVYAVVELMGHKRLTGRLQTAAVADLLQLDVPVEGGFVTQLINPASVYRVTIVDEATVREYAKGCDPLPAITLEVQPYQRELSYHPYDEQDY